MVYQVPILAPDTSRAATPHAAPGDEVVATLGSDERLGLDEARVGVLLERFGTNQLAEPPSIPAWRRFLAQFNELVVWILVVAAIVSGVLGEWPDAVAILAIVLLNGLLGFFQEEKAGRSLAGLQKLSAPLAKVIRGGVLQTAPAADLVPGDRVELEAGDFVPADVRLLRGYAFRVQEAALTGESVPVNKEPDAVLGPATPLGDRRNMAYMGTSVSAGTASAVVVSTGMQTELGRIAGLLQRHEPEPTPLQRRLAELGKVLIAACLGIVAVVLVLQLLRGGGLLEVFLVAVGLSVAAVPEGLPAVVTTALALGLQRLVRRNALVRKLPSVETLGSVTVICSDKTGTLTRNEMTVRELVTGSERYTVTGAGYAPRGQFLKGESQTEIDPRADADLLQALLVGLRCNHAQVVSQGDGADGWKVIGDPTEGALVVVALKAGLKYDTGRAVFEVPFDSDRKAMSVVVEEAGGAAVMFTKGAPEVVLGKCDSELRGGTIESLGAARRQAISQSAAEMASRALRVLGLAYKPLPADSEGQPQESGLVFAGLAGMIDPPREEAKEAVRKCHEAGIRPVMITGDHPSTALAIARELAIARDGDRVVTGQELNAMSDDELAEQVETIPVYARVSAEHKLRVVKAWKARGQVVAMTGDGVNDAPAVQSADIGIAMGVSGTDVTKEASAMVLTDDNFASIVNAVEEGRCIFDNIQKVLVFLLSCNAGEILLVLLASLLGWPVPLLPIQLLWINLVTDGLPALMLSLEPAEPGIMKRRPRPPREPVLTWERGLSILLQGALLGGVSLAAFAIVYLVDPGRPEQVGHARTTAFCVLVFAELLRSLAARSQTIPLTRLGFLTNPYLLGTVAVSALLHLGVVTLPFVQPVFGAVAHFAWEWVVVGLLALVPITVLEVIKIVRLRWSAKATP